MKNKSNELNQTVVISITNSNNTNKEIVHLNTDKSIKLELHSGERYSIAIKSNGLLLPLEQVVAVAKANDLKYFHQRTNQ